MYLCTMSLHFSSQHTSTNDTIKNRVWYVMRPKSNMGARAIPAALSVIEKYNKEKKGQDVKGQETHIQSDDAEYDVMTAYAPRYKQQVNVGVYRDRYVFSDLFFVYTSADTMKKFMKDNPYQIFYIQNIHDNSKRPDTNVDEHGNKTHDDYLRVSSKAIEDLRLSLKEYHDDIRVFTAHELQKLKYTRKAIIVDGPLKGRICRIKAIEGKQRVIVDLLEGNLSLVIVMPDTHFERIKG